MAGTADFNYLEPIEVARGVFWIGEYDRESGFHCNPYLLMDGEEAILFDPAGLIDYPKVAGKIFSLIDPEQVSHIVLHHQDPDLCTSTPMLEDILPNKELKIVTHSLTSRFIRYYGVKSAFHAVDRNGYRLELKSGRVLRFIVTPFCHFPTAIATYDENERLLFSSDLFAAISTDWHLYAGEGYEAQMEPFHVDYMPSRRHLSAVMDVFAGLDLEMILPQHGSIIRGEMIDRCIAFLKEIRCGIDARTGRELFGWLPD
jgi:flavorubredoxin